MNKIIVFGGSFNPPTKAHLELGIKALESINADKLCFVPVGDKYSKVGLEQAEHRVNMLNIICSKIEDYKLEVDLTEVNALKNFNTIDTLRDFKKRYGEEVDIYFLLGADNLLYLSEWNESEEIVRNFKILTVRRDGYDIANMIKGNKLLNKYKKNIVEISIDTEMMISSTMVRELIKQNDNIVNNYIDSDVKNYILKNNLYR